MRRCAAEHWHDLRRTAFCAVARNVLDDIDILTSAVISLSGQTLSILIGKHGPRCEQHALRNNILGGYQLDVMTLTLKLKRAGIIDLFIIRGKFIKKNSYRNSFFPSRNLPRAAHRAASKKGAPSR